MAYGYIMESVARQPSSSSPPLVTLGRGFSPIEPVGRRIRSFVGIILGLEELLQITSPETRKHLSREGSREGGRARALDYGY